MAILLSYKKAIEKIHYILSFKKYFHTVFDIFFLHAYRNTYFSCRPKTKAKISTFL